MLPVVTPQLELRPNQALVVAEAQGVKAVGGTVATVGQFTTDTARRPLKTGERQLTVSADPAKLWGKREPEEDHFDPAEFQKRTPADRGSALQRLRGRAEHMKLGLREHVLVLGHCWRELRSEGRAKALHHYHDHVRLPDEAKGEIRVALVRADAAKEKIEALSTEQQGGSKLDQALRGGRVLLARIEQASAVGEAAKVIDDKGLQVDFLAHTEQIINPAAPKPGSGHTLLEEIKDYLNVVAVIQTMETIIANLRDSIEKQDEERRRADKEDAEKARMTASDLKKRMEAARTRDQDLKAYVERLRDLETPHVLEVPAPDLPTTTTSLA